MDDNSDGLGPRNRGTNAVFVTKSTPFYPLNDNNTNGVFLDQSVASGNYYSVRTAQNIYATGLMWSFGYWSYSNASLSSTTNLETAVVFTASNATVTANYNTVVKPLLLDAVWITADEGDGKIRLNWDENPSSNVQYKIYRKVNGGSPSLLTTVNHGTATWKDNAYYYSDEHTSYNLSYDVRCYHQPTATYSDERWWSAFGSLYPPQAWGSGPLARKKPSKITFEGYPNPFNPSTKLMFSLKEDSRVQLFVYDILGRSVAELVDGPQHAGYYSYTWNAVNLVTGVYFARLVVQAENEKPFVLTSKLLLAK